MGSTATDRNEILHWLGREKEARLAAAASSDPKDRDHHHMLAERHADRAWSLAEEGEHDFIPSGLWPGTAKLGAVAAASEARA